jgi:Tol biopolymer transport system component
MRKLGAIFIFVYLAACSTGETVMPTITADVPPASTPVSTQTSVPPPTYTPAPTPTTMPTALPTAMGGGAGKIAFTSERDGYPEIYLINVDGSGLIKLANNITPKFNPAWSPDGRKIAFGSNDKDTASIYIMNADGSNPTKLIDTKEISVYDQANPDWRFAPGCCYPTWSPDGKKIAIQIVHYVGCCARHSKNYVINADGSNLEVVDQPGGYSAPVWSPDSQKIAFDGSVWSPDGKKVAFARDWGGAAAIHVMNADGTNPVRLTHSGSPWDHAPSWSPDGSKITFLSYRDGNYEIYIVNADGTNLLNLTKNPVDEGGQVWSPDGTKIAFVSARDGNPGIFVIDIDGTNLIRLTTSNTSDYSLAWSP